MNDVLFPPPPPPPLRRLDARFTVAKEADIWVVLADGGPVASFHADDTAARDLLIAQLCMHSDATEVQVAFGFDVSRPTVSRAKRKYVGGGLPALVARRPGPKGPTKLKGARERVMVQLAKDGMSNARIGERLGVTGSAVSRALSRLGVDWTTTQPDELPWPDPTVSPVCDATPACRHDPVVVPLPPVPPPVDVPAAAVPPAAVPTAPTPSTELPPLNQASGAVPPVAHPSPLPAATALPVESTLDADPDHRVIDRMLARLGMLDDAAPLFGNHDKVRQLGVLLVFPILCAHHVFVDTLGVFGAIGPAFYGVRNSVVALLLMFLLRVGRPEHLKEQPPGDLGRVMGLDRYPEMKTLRRKIHRLAAQGKSLELMQRLTERHLKRLGGGHLWLYLDGHVQVYSGKRKLKKHHSTRLRTSLPAVLDYWINDENSDPLLVITAAPKQTMKALPALIAELRAAGETRPITLVFDREGWSPELFAQLAAMPGVYFLTYRKAKANRPLPRLAENAFTCHQGVVADEPVTFQLADQTIYVDYGSRRPRRRLQLRQVTRLTDDGHQTHIVTNHQEIKAFEVAQRMFGRWGQENYFKYGRSELALDGLYTYQMEDGDENRLVANPARQKLATEIARLENVRDQLVTEYGDRALTNPEKRRKTMRGFKIANGELASEIRAADERLCQLRVRHAALPAQVPVKETLHGEKAQQVNVEVRRLIHCFRIIAYRAESTLRQLVRPTYPRWRQDGRTLIQSMLQSSGDLEVTATELRVRLHPQSAPHRTLALATLCDHLNSLDATFPGTSLRLRYSVKDHGSVS